jgi:hypothetical protein
VWLPCLRLHPGRSWVHAFNVARCTSLSTPRMRLVKLPRRPTSWHAGALTTAWLLASGAASGTPPAELFVDPARSPPRCTWKSRRASAQVLPEARLLEHRAHRDGSEE